MRYLNDSLLIFKVPNTDSDITKAPLQYEILSGKTLITFVISIFRYLTINV